MVLSEIVGDTANTGAFSGFDSLISPLTAKSFMDTYFQQRPFYVSRDQPGYFDPVITVDGLDALLGLDLWFPDEIRVVRKGLMINPEEYIGNCADGRTVVSRQRLLELYLRDATIIFEKLEKKHRGFISLLARCEAELEVPFRANCYLTPARSSGFRLHYDTHDVLILQVAGRKVWRIHDNPVVLPAVDQVFRTRYTDRSTLIAEIELCPGSVLYLPRGYIHAAETRDAASLHVTVGIHSQTLRDFAMWAFQRELRNADVRGQSSVRALEPSDIEDARLRIEGFASRMNMSEVRAASKINLQRKRMRPYGHALELGHVSTNSHGGLCLRLDPCAMLTLVIDNDGIVVYFDSSFMRFPKRYSEALRAIAEGRPFARDALPGLAGKESSELCTELCRHRLLVTAEPSAAIGAATVPSGVARWALEGCLSGLMPSSLRKASDLLSAFSIGALRRAVSCRGFRKEEVAVMPPSGTAPKYSGQYIDQQWLLDAIEGAAQLVFRDVHRTVPELSHPVWEMERNSGRLLAVDGYVLHAKSSSVTWTAEHDDIDILQIEGTVVVQKFLENGAGATAEVAIRLGVGEALRLRKGDTVRIQAAERTAVQLKLRWRPIVLQEVIIGAIGTSVQFEPRNRRVNAMSLIDSDIGEQLSDAVLADDFSRLLAGEYWRLRGDGDSIVSELVVRRIDRSAAVTEDYLVQLLQDRKWALIRYPHRGVLSCFIQCEGFIWQISDAESEAIGELQCCAKMLISRLPLDSVSERVRLARTLMVIGVAELIPERPDSTVIR